MPADPPDSRRAPPSSAGAVAAVDHAPDSDVVPRAESKGGVVILLSDAAPRDAAVSRDALAQFLCSSDTRRYLWKVLKRKIRYWDREDVLHDTLLAAWSAPNPPAGGAMKTWLTTIARRKIVDYYRSRSTRTKNQVFGVDVERLSDEERKQDRKNKDLLVPYLRTLIANPEDAETLLLIIEKARRKLTYAKLAAEHDTTEDALRKRVDRFRDKYMPFVRRHLWENRALAILLALLVAALVWVVVRGFACVSPPRAVPDVRPEPTALTPEPFEPAESADEAVPRRVSAEDAGPVLPPEKAPAKAPRK